MSDSIAVRNGHVPNVGLSRSGQQLLYISYCLSNRIGDDFALLCLFCGNMSLTVWTVHVYFFCGNFGIADDCRGWHSHCRQPACPRMPPAWPRMTMHSPAPAMRGRDRKKVSKGSQGEQGLELTHEAIPPPQCGGGAGRRWARAHKVSRD